MKFAKNTASRDAPGRVPGKAKPGALPLYKEVGLRKPQARRTDRPFFGSDSAKKRVKKTPDFDEKYPKNPKMGYFSQNQGTAFLGRLENFG
jgi:hypothetical protein